MIGDVTGIKGMGNKTDKAGELESESVLTTAEPAYSYNLYSRFLAIVELNLVPSAFISLLF